MQIRSSRSRMVIVAAVILFLLGVQALPADAWTGNFGQTAKLFGNRVLSVTKLGKFAGLYLNYEGVHMSRSKQWAMDLGFSKNDADAIAKACNAVDSGATFKDKTWHLGNRWAYGTTWSSADRTDPRLDHAQYYLACAKDAKRAGNTALALQYLGNGLHPLQDYYAHMNAGVYYTGTGWTSNFHHGERGTFVDMYISFDGYNFVKMPYPVEVETLYDSVNADYTMVNGSLVWVYQRKPVWNTRLQAAEKASKDYIYEYLNS
ncbi:MAG: hypothetical protein ACM3QZ_01755 [Solirubrobacterales bacterium]